MCSLSIISYAIFICKEKIYITVNFSTKKTAYPKICSREILCILSVHQAMLYTVMLLRTLCIIPAVNSAYQITGNTADTLEFCWLEGIIQGYITISSRRNSQCAEFFLGVILYIINIAQKWNLQMKNFLTVIKDLKN